ncbi:hypothetical protein JBKA6_1081 [Ichthyobacterium seriolicida]|uniref:Uncharacterized protein n=1 Tax=Ichthyobacterium seriolicida TaxID=242600 RepID=A0A1J1E6X7_9FLAO|nr:hypothetical protein JBKA6_1081 [Ichthyobacterium seriolicida]
MQSTSLKDRLSFSISKAPRLCVKGVSMHPISTGGLLNTGDELS